MRLRRVSDGKTLAIDERRDLIRAGGEGKVFRTPDNRALVAKVYHSPGDRRAKLEAMLQNPPRDDATPGHASIAWPIDLLEETDGARRVVGFVMPRVDRASGFHEFSNPTLRAKKHPQFTFRDLHIVASNAASAFWALHDKGYVVGDVNEGNLLIRDDALATVVDADSFQVPKADGTTFRCRVGREEFTPPELQGLTLADIDREVAHDLFGMSVLLFQLLMEGFHPFSGVPTFQGEAWPLGRRIVDGNFPWGGSSTPFKVPPLAPPLKVLDPRLQKLFIQAFESRNGRPEARLWKRELDAAIERLRQCKQNAQHWYGRYLKACPWCEREQKLASLSQAQKQMRVDQSSPSTSVPVQRPAPPPPPPPVFTPEIQPGRWRFHSNQQAVQAMGGLANADQIYDLRPDGSCIVQGVMVLMGVGVEFLGNGRWTYDYVNKVLVINGMLQMKMNFGDAFMNMFAGSVPPQPLNAHLTVVSGSPGRWMVRDSSNGLTYLFERL
jgi:DNA-binding helix-hairpin-helix protein with protein kinase domain